MKRFCYPLIASFLALTFFSQCSYAYGIQCDFSQDHRTYTWNFLFDYAPDTSLDLSWGLESSMNSIITKRSGGPDWLQEDGRIDLKLDYRLTGKISVGSFFSQDIYSSEETRATTSDYGISSEFELAGIRFIQSLGVKMIDRQDSSSTEPEISQQGFGYDQIISASPRILSNSVTQMSVSQSLVELKKIPLQRRELSLAFSKALSDSPIPGSHGDSLRMLYNEGWAKKRFFSGTTQKKNHRDINLNASGGVPLGIRMNLNVDYLRDRDRRYLPERDLLGFYLLSSSLSAELQLEKNFWRRVQVEGFYRYMRSEWDYLGEESDQVMEGGELGGRVEGKISQVDSAYLSASVGVTSYYAPVSGQFNDRDKLTVLVWGEYLHVFSPHLEIRLEGGFKNFHLTYMSEQFSFENNHDQTYVLTPAITWFPHRKLTLRQKYSIKANYRYYDYQKASETGRNSLLRRASSFSDLEFRYSERMTFFAGYSYRYEDDGPLIWKDQWVQRISRDQRINSVSLSLAYRPMRNLTVSPKYTYEERKSWDHEAEETGDAQEKTLRERRLLGNRFFRKMISITLRYLVSQENYLYLSAAHRLQDDTQSRQEISDYITVSIARIF